MGRRDLSYVMEIGTVNYMNENEIFLNDGERLDVVNDGIKLIQRVNGLVFGSDALLLAGYVRGKKGQRMVELGGGTGIISLLLMERDKGREVYIYEIQPEFAELCQRNASINGFSDRVRVINGDIRSASSSDTSGEVDVVFSNPPYMKMGCGKENAYDEKNIARRETAGGILDFCRAASKLLKFGGAFYTVFPPERLSELIESGVACKLEPKRLTLVCPDLGARPCLTLVEFKKGGGKGMYVTPPLYIKNNGKESDCYRFIMDNGDFDELYKKV